MHDVAVVGAGIVGLAVARELKLRDPSRAVVVAEREREVATHQTGSNSGVIHAGIYYAPGSLKARLCVEGAQRMYDYCDAHGIPYERCGKLIVALDRDELPRLDALEARGRANGVPGLRRLDAAGLCAIEPECRGIAALHSPATGIVDFAAVARAIADELRSQSVEIRLGADRPPPARRTIYCAGLAAHRLAVAGGAPADPRTVPFRGSYLRVRPEARPLVRGLIYPVPDPALPFLGVHLTRRIDGDVLLGPTALLAGGLTWPGTWRVMRRHWRPGLRELRMAADRRALVAACARYVPALRPEHVLPGRTSGTRAQAVARDGTLVDDFVLHETAGAVHVRNAPSPAATSAFALAAEIADRIQRVGPG